MHKRLITIKDIDAILSLSEVFFNAQTIGSAKRASNLTCVCLGLQLITAYQEGIYKCKFICLPQRFVTMACLAVPN
jgi:hypothetical protein